MITVRHADTWADAFGVWIILEIIIDGVSTTKLVRVKGEAK